MSNDTFHALSEVRDEINRRLEQANIKLLDPTFFTLCDRSFTSGVPYGATVQHSTPICTYKGRATSKYAHASVYRKECGRYELTFYVL